MIDLVVRRLGLSEYVKVWEAMQDFTTRRGPTTSDEVWILEHDPVFTLGLGAKPKHLLDPGPIPVIQVDRGGQVTYHGPGQLVAYVMLDLKRRGLGVKRLVTLLEDTVINLLEQFGATARKRLGAPGVYIDDAKIAAVGLRIRRGCSYHGLSLNVHMDLGPYACINPCGYPGLCVTQMRDLGVKEGLPEVGDLLVEQLRQSLNGLARTPREPLNHAQPAEH